MSAEHDFIVIGRAASKLGCGIAYAAGERGVPWRFAYLLNSTADDIDPAFAAWLESHWGDIRETMRRRAPNCLKKAELLVKAGDVYGVNAPREFYGDIMGEVSAKVIARLRTAGATVRLVDTEATAVEKTSTGVRFRIADGQAFGAASVDIAPGSASTIRFDEDDGPFSAPTVFGHEHSIAEHILAGREIFCIGGKAAMLDVLRLCQSLIPKDKLRFTACAPEGAIPPLLITGCRAS